ncbi:MAG: zinc ribbon domain-containing protein [Nostoc sp.]|uniref:zinc ribbon domain-containing protein n=2 Tax=Nostoc TaxID=1177 RepID=UPI002FF11672
MINNQCPMPNAQCLIFGESYRSGKKFVCGHCGWIGDADLNGAKNISTIGAVIVNQPRGSGLSCKLDVRGGY